MRLRGAFLSLLPFLGVLGGFGGLGGLSACAHAETWRFAAAERVVALSDVHGADQAFMATLRAAQVVDAQGRWSAGKSRLVVTGDLLDRGAGSRAAMDLLRRLEGEARAAGGAVHVTLGNHEVMNLVGDLRYVAAAEYAAFAADEDPAERTAARNAYLAARTDRDVGEVRAEFDEKFPAGYFGHRRAFAADGEYGSWLLDKPALIVIGDTAFMHGGLPADVARRGGDGVNRLARDTLLNYLTWSANLIEAGVIPADAPFYDHPALIEAYALRVTQGTAQWSDEAKNTAGQLKALHEVSTFNTDGVLWYRGTAGCSPAIEEARLDASLAEIGARRAVIGHTPNPHGVRSRLNGKVIRIDTGMLHEAYGGRGAALVLEGGSIRVVYQDGTTTDVMAEVSGAPSALGLTRMELETALRGAELSSHPGEGPLGGEGWTASVGGYDLAVDFVPGGRGADTFLPDVAAYRIDQLLGLDMVPITVAREVEGRRGSLQLIAHRLVSEAERLQSGGNAFCPLGDQFTAMYVFDGLLGNARPTETLRYVPGSWALRLTGHENAFGTSRSPPPHLTAVLSDLSSSWRARLARLDEQKLRDVLHDVLDDRRIKAMLRRRDRMLK